GRTAPARPPRGSRISPRSSCSAHWPCSGSRWRRWPPPPRCASAWSNTEVAMNWTWFHRLGSPPHVYALAGRLTPWFAWPAALLIAGGLWGGLVLAPPDYQQGDGFRIIYVHAPSAWMSLMVYTTMAVAAAVGLVWRIKVAHAVAASCAPIGASFTVAALVTGSLWGQPMWGTYWQWDPRLTSELILLFFYMGYSGLRGAIDDINRADRAAAVLAIV